MIPNILGGSYLKRNSVNSIFNGPIQFNDVITDSQTILGNKLFKAGTLLSKVFNKLLYKLNNNVVSEGTNKLMGTATLVGGTVTVNNTAVKANSRIFVTRQSTGGTAGAVGVSTRTAGTSFTITSTSGTDTSVVAYIIYNPEA